ncbi:MAG: 1-acyl-sn-glycerol-3-phosphate acyltransferase [Lachnospiraceae bacterium]|nr:1-acyl-sn-glycerol-3-phosphate acyltransferase [Lachnospiraceae bacterium]
MNSINILNRKLRKKSNLIPVFFAIDDKYVKYFAACLKSLINHTSSENKYNIHILHEDITNQNQERIKEMETENVSISFENVTKRIDKIRKKLSIRDYYSYTTYYRIFIADMFPQYDKVLYLDADTLILKDVALLYQYELDKNYVGAVNEQVMVNHEIFGNYVEQVLGISRMAYFNAGVLLINCKQFRRQNILQKFVDLINAYTFVVTQDEDYLNIICQDKILWMDINWNYQSSDKTDRNLDEVGIIHYAYAIKPWHSKDVRHSEVYWNVAKETMFYPMLKSEYDARTAEDNAMFDEVGVKLEHIAMDEMQREDNYLHKYLGIEQPKITRQDIIKKIEQYEKEGRFDEDVEDDPPSRELMPDEVDYLRKNMSNRMRTRYAFRLARWFMNIMIRKKQLIIKDIIGIEHYRNLKSGAIITCNHFNAMDSFAMHIAYEKSRQRRRKFFRIIREGNYTSFPGFYGLLMRNCNTLPLSSNKETMKKFIKAVDTILQKGHFILIYPEQSMWWNYKKPKPLKKGGFTFAAKNNVPVLPCFVTMEDSNVPGEGGLPVQEYTIHISEPIYPDSEKSRAANVKDMMDKNYAVWKEIYEKTYGIPLKYSCDE